MDQSSGSNFGPGFGTGKGAESTSSEDSSRELSWLLDSLEQTLQSINDKSVHKVISKLLSALRSVPGDGAPSDSMSSQGKHERSMELLVNLYDQLGLVKTWEKLETETLPTEAKLRIIYLRSKARRSLMTLSSNVKLLFALDVELDLTGVQLGCDGAAVGEIRDHVQKTLVHEGLHDNSKNPDAQRDGDALDVILSTSEFDDKARATLRDLEDGAREDIPWMELDWANKEHIDGGSFGQVWRTRWGSIPVAVKELRYRMQHTELECMKKLYHPNIVQLYGTSMEPERHLLAFVMELCDMSLSKYLHKCDPKSFPAELDFVKDIGADVCCGLMFIFCHNIIHRDLKPANVLLKKRSDRYHAKICDFGVSLNEVPINVTRTDPSPCGTILYMAPEQIVSQSYASPKTDIYSLGIVLWEILERKEPWGGKTVEEIKSLVRSGIRPEFTEGSSSVPESLKDLIKRCWDGETKNRPYASKIYAILRSKDTLSRHSVETLSAAEVILRPKDTCAGNFVENSIPGGANDLHGGKSKLSDSTLSTSVDSSPKGTQHNGSNNSFPGVEPGAVYNVISGNGIASVGKHESTRKWFQPLCGRQSWCLLVILILVGGVTGTSIAVALAIAGTGENPSSTPTSLTPSSAPTRPPLQPTTFVTRSPSLRNTDAPTFIPTASPPTLIPTTSSPTPLPVAPGSQLRILHFHQKQVESVAAYTESSANNAVRVASCSRDETVKIWSPGSQSWIFSMKRVSRRPGDVMSVTTYRDRDNAVFIVSGSADRSIKIWRAADGSWIRTIGNEQTKHTHWVNSVATYKDASAGNAVRIVSGSYDHSIKIWSATNGALLHTLRSHTDRVYAVTTYEDPLQDNAVFIVSGSRDKTIKIWSAASGSLVHTIDKHDNVVWSVTAYKDQESNSVHIVSGSADKTIRTWSTVDFSQIQHRNTGARVYSLAVYEDPAASDALRIVSGSGNPGKAVKIWSAADLSLIHTMTGHKEKVLAVTTYKDPSANNAVRIVSGSEDTTARIWSAV